MRKIKQLIIKMIYRIGIPLLSSFCRLLPLKNRVLFYSIRSDGVLLENSKAVYDALDAEKAVFAKKLPHAHKFKPKIYRMLLTSRVIVTDDYLRYLRSFKLRKGQAVIQIWHACGAFKMFGLDAPSRQTKRQELATHAQYTDVIVSAEGVREHYAGAFGLPVEKIKALGVPRTDNFSDADTMDALRTQFYDGHPEMKQKTIYTYFPTFREAGGAQIPFDPKLDWAALSASLGGDAVLLVKRHPVMKQSLWEGAYPNVLDMTASSATTLLSVSQAIVTDYSSILFDAALLNLPVILYCPDFDTYERNFYLDFPDAIPGPFITDGDQLVKTLRHAKINPERYAAFKQEQLGACDGNATKRVAAQIKSYLK